MTQMTDVALIKQQITINAPAQKFFAVVANLENIPCYTPNMSSEATQVDDAITIIYSPKLPGLNLPLPFSLRFKVGLVDVQEPTVVAMHMDGPVKGTARYDLESQGIPLFSNLP